MVALVRQEKEKLSSTTTCLSLRPPYPAYIATKAYLMGSTMTNFQKFDSLKGSIREQVSRFIDALGPFAHNADFSKEDLVTVMQQMKKPWFMFACMVYLTNSMFSWRILRFLLSPS